MSKGIVIGSVMFTTKSGGSYASDGFHAYRRLMPFIYIRIKTKDEVIFELKKTALVSVLFVAMFWALDILPLLISWRGVGAWVVISVIAQIKNTRPPK